MRQQHGDALVLQKSVIQKEHQGEISLPLSKGGYKKVPAHCVKAVIQNLPLHGVFSYTEHTPFRDVARIFRGELERCCGQKFVDRLIGASDRESGMILPIRYLPDLFIASPVLYAYKTKEEDRSSYQTSLSENNQKKLGLFHPALRNLCDIFPNQQWRDVIQLFNRVCRSMDRYDGDAIPEKLQSQMDRATEICDDIFIATPYHDAAVRDLDGVRAWLPQRAKNPYVLGIIRRLPFVIVLGRFDDSPLFSAYPPMLADTVEFLRANTKTLKTLNKTDKHPWYYGGASSTTPSIPLGTRLTSSVEKMVEISDKGFLFDWFREGYTEHT